MIVIEGWAPDVGDGVRLTAMVVATVAARDRLIRSGVIVPVRLHAVSDETATP